MTTDPKKQLRDFKLMAAALILTGAILLVYSIWGSYCVFKVEGFLVSNKKMPKEVIPSLLLALKTNLMVALPATSFVLIYSGFQLKKWIPFLAKVLSPQGTPSQEPPRGA